MHPRKPLGRNPKNLETAKRNTLLEGSMVHNAGSSSMCTYSHKSPSILGYCYGGDLVIMGKWKLLCYNIGFKV